jgi:hypothetical protein
MTRRHGAKAERQAGGVGALCSEAANHVTAAKRRGWSACSVACLSNWSRHPGGANTDPSP